MRQRNNMQTIERMRAISRQFEEMQRLDIYEEIETAARLVEMKESSDPTMRRKYNALEQLRGQLELCHAE